MSAEELQGQARAAAREGDVMKAIQLARQAIMQDPSMIGLLDELAQTYAKREKPPALGQVASDAQRRIDAEADAHQRHQQAIEAAQKVKIPLLSSLSPHAFVAMARRMEEVSFEAGETIVQEGAPGERMYIIIEGKAAVRRNASDVAQLSGGDFFGELALLTSQPRLASVVASEPCRCFAVDKALLNDLCEVYPQVGTTARQFAQQRLGEAALHSSALFGQLAPEARAALVARFMHQTYEDQEVILEEGGMAKGLLVVLFGQVVASVLDEEIATLGAGELVGEISTLFKTQPTAQVKAKGQVAVMWLLPGDVQKALEPYPDLLKSLEELGQERWALI